MNNHEIGLISLAAIFRGFVALGLIIAFWTTRWDMQRNRKSPSFTTSFRDIPLASIR